MVGFFTGYLYMESIMSIWQRMVGFPARSITRVSTDYLQGIVDEV